MAAKSSARSIRHVVVGLAVAALGVGVAAAVIPQAVAAGPSLAVVAARPLAPRGAHALGRVPSTQQIHGVIGLKPRNAAALTKYATAISSPSSPLYKHFLPAGQFASTFGVPSARLHAVESSLRSSGVMITSVSRGGLLLKYRATAAHAEAAFHTTLERYQLRSGRTAFAPTSALRLPASIASSVQSVVGLNSLLRPQHVSTQRGGTGHRAAAAPAATPSVAGGPAACSAARTTAEQSDGLTDDQLAAAYGMNPLYSAGANGSGQTIAVYELEPFLNSDLKTFDTCYFGATKATQMLSRVNIVKVDGGGQDGPGSGESILDMEDVSALAPGANIEVYNAPNTFAALIDNFDQIVQDDSASIVTSSWFSGCEPDVTAQVPGFAEIENVVFEQAAVQGQTVLEASGDDGSDGCALHADTPAAPVLSGSLEESMPFVLSVGGTTMTQATTPPVESVWNDGSEWGAAGGGLSALWHAPSWQADSGVPGMANSQVISAAQSQADAGGYSFCSPAAVTCRETPDVSAQADQFTGAVTVYAHEFGGWLTIGGTSSATPLWAAMLADVASTSACGALGFVSPKLYAIAHNPAQYKASFNDVTVGNTDVFGATGGLYPATPGYDMATGLGTPKFTGAGGSNGLAHYLCTATSDIVPTVTNVSPAALPLGGGTVTITGTGFKNGATPDVAGVQVGNVQLATANVTVDSATQLTATFPVASHLVSPGSPNTGAGDYAVLVTLADNQTSVPSSASRIVYYSNAGSSKIPEVDGIGSFGGNESGGRTVRVVGAGFDLGTATPTVTFGGVTATGVTVQNDHHLSVVVPPYSALNTTCATAMDPTVDVCQVQVQVTTSEGVSAESTILPEYAGDLSANPSGAEEFPAPTEFDYLPTPTITSVTVDSGLAAESGGSVATITGTGLGILGLDWVNVGPYQNDSSQDRQFLATGTGAQQGKVLVMVLPGIAPTVQNKNVSVTAQTEGSTNITSPGGIDSAPPSTHRSVSYVGIPAVSSIAAMNGSHRLSYTAGPQSGGTKLVINGAGLDNTGLVLFTDVGRFGGAFGASNATSYSFTATATKVTLLTPSDNAGVDQVSACSLSGCSSPVKNDIFTFYPNGNPRVSSISPASAKPGAKVTIRGANLGFITAVYFGTAKSPKVANLPSYTDAGERGKITAVVPKGTKGHKVAIQVTTLESLATGYGKSHGTAVKFTFK